MVYANSLVGWVVGFDLLGNSPKFLPFPSSTTSRRLVFSGK